MSNIVLLAPAPDMSFASLPSGSTYISDANGLIQITNGSVADQTALVNAGCVTLNPVPGGGYNFQNGTAYTVQAGDNGNLLLLTSSSAVTVSLPANLPVGFRLRVFQAGAGALTIAAGAGASVVSPIGVLTSSTQYTAFDCAVISANGWDAIISPTPTGGGLIGAASLSALYAQDTASHYAQYSIGQVFQDGTSSNNGLWLKTGSGNGSGNWTQQPPAGVTLASLNTALAATNTAAAAEAVTRASADSGIVNLVGAANFYLWADDGNFVGGIFDINGYPIAAITPGGALVGAAFDALPAGSFAWADEPAFAQYGGGIVPNLDSGGSVILAYGAAPGALDDYCPYVNKPDGSLRATNNAPIAAGLDLSVASTRGSPSTGGISGVHQMGPILKFMDDATASGNAPLHERRQFDYRGGNYLAGIGGITRLIHVIDIGHSLTIGATAGLLTTAPFFNRGVMFNGGPKVVQPNGSGHWNTPAPICDDANLQSFAEYYEFQNSGAQGETHGGGVIQWFSVGSNIAATEAALFCSVGAGGAILANLLSGTTQFSNLLRVAERSAALAAFNGWGWECYVTCSIGENDYLTYAGNASGFQTNLVALQASIQTAIQGIFAAQGWTVPTCIPLICEQPSSWTDSVYNLATCALAYVFPALARSSPNLFRLVGPEYYTDNYTPGGGTSGVHKTALGYKLDGQYMARTVQKIRAAAATPGLYITGASNSGTTLTLTTNGTTNLAIDTSVVSDPGQSGLRCLDTSAGNANVVLSSIAASGTSIIATMAAKTTGHVYMIGAGDIGTAGNNPGPTTGPRTTIRDSSADVSSTDTASTPMYNYLSHDQFTFTAA